MPTTATRRRRDARLIHIEETLGVTGFTLIPGGLYQALVTVTPEMALCWMDLNSPNNRRITPRRFKGMSGDMVAGRWRLTHQSIAFDQEMVLVDGQHRLTAGIDAEVSFQTYVTVGINTDSVTSIDTGAVRNPSDAARFLGYHLTHRDVAALRRYEWSPGREHKITNERILEAYAARHAGMDFLHANFGTGGRGKKLGVDMYTTAPVQGAVMRAFYTPDVDHPKLRRFCEVLITGVCNGEPESSAIALRNFIHVPSQKNRGFRGRLQTNSLFLRAQRAIQAFMEGTPLQVMRPISRECYPKAD